MAQTARSILTLQACSYNTLTPHVPAPLAHSMQLPPGETTLTLDYPQGNEKGEVRF